MGGEKKEPLHKSFGYAWEGITAVIKKERNMKIHCCVMILVILAGAIFRIAAWKWCICFCLFGLVMSLEIVNTAVEAVVDLAVLLAAIMAVIGGLVRFVPEGREFLCMVLK